MRVFRVVSAAILAAVVAGIPAGSQSLSQVEGPAELPPADYTGNQYVDSTGCVFVRAGVGGEVSWVPRVGRDRKLVCGYDPTFPPGFLESLKAVAEAAEKAEGEKAPSEEPAGETAEEVATEAPAPAAPAAPVSVESTETKLATAQPKTAAETVKPPKPVVRAEAKPDSGAEIHLVEARAIMAGETFCANRLNWAQRYLLSDGRRVTACNGRAQEAPVEYLNGLGLPGVEVESGPASDAASRRAKAHDDAGNYRVTWSSGPLNPTGEAARAEGKARKVGGMAPSAEPVAVAGRFVQVGAFGDPANADRAAKRLAELNLPVRTSRNGSGLQIVMAGPFDTAEELVSALSLLRKSGYPDAFPRR